MLISTPPYFDSSSISVTSEVSVPLVVVSTYDVVDVHEYVTNVLSQAVSEGTLTAAIVVFANQLGQRRRRLDGHSGLRRLDAGGMSAASVESVSVDTFSPSPAPSLAPTSLPTPSPTTPEPTTTPTPAPTPAPTASQAPTSLPSPSPTAAPIYTEVRTYNELQQAISQASASSTKLVIDLLADIVMTTVTFIRSEVTIRSPVGAVLSGGGSTRLIYVYYAPLVVENITLREGYASVSVL